MCVVPNLGFGLFFEKSQLLPTSFGSPSVLKLLLRIQNKTNAIFRVYLLKNRCWNLPFRKTPLFAVATSSDWWRTASSRRFGVGKHRFPAQKLYLSHMYNFWRETSFVNSVESFGAFPIFEKRGTQKLLVIERKRVNLHLGCEYSVYTWYFWLLSG